MTQKHTPEPWRVDEYKNPCLMFASIEVDHGKVKFIASVYTTNHSEYGNETARANAERIVACVNACAGIHDPKELIEGADIALRERDALRKLLREVSDTIFANSDMNTPLWIEDIRAKIKHV